MAQAMDRDEGRLNHALGVLWIARVALRLLTQDGDNRVQERGVRLAIPVLGCGHEQGPIRVGVGVAWHVSPRSAAL